MTNEKDILSHYIGSGKLKLLDNNEEMDFNIEVIIYLNTEIDVILKSKEISAKKMGLIDKFKCSFYGELNNDKKIYIPDAAINSTDFSMKQSEGCCITIKILTISDIFIWDKSYSSHEEVFKNCYNIKVGLINFLFDGRYMTHYPSGQSRRDCFKINVLGKNLVIKQLEKYDEIKKILKEKKNNMLTSELLVDNIRYDPTIGSLIYDLFMLASFSQKTLISRFYTEFLNGANQIMIIYHSEKKYPYSNSSPLIDSRHLGNNDIEEFLESTFNEYQRLRAMLKMNILFDIICNAEIAEVLESKYLLQITALELAIEQYRKEMGVDVDEDADLLDGIEKCISNFTSKKGIELSQEFIKELSVKLGHKTFKNKVKAVIRALKLTYSDSEIDRIKDNRNKIVHELHFKDYSQPLQDYLLLRLLVDKIILKILNYNGYILNYMNKYNREKID